MGERIMDIGVITSINVNPDGGVPKYPIDTTKLTINGVEGDKQRYKNHGGIERAVALYSLEKILELQKEGHPIYPGSTGENITIKGLDWNSLQEDDQLEMGNVVIQLTFPAIVCNTIKESFINNNVNQMDSDINPGWARWYASVVNEGNISVGDTVRLTNIQDVL
tara:strand:- start:101 stop:595 length:495 start_codon:yes stop_codon:yes gene_type:complete